MSFPHRTHLRHVLPVALVVCLAPCAVAMQAFETAPSAAPSAGVAESAAPIDAAPVARSYPPAAPTPEAPLNDLFGRLSAGEGPVTDAVLVIPGKPMDPQAIGRIVEDLSVMGRIIQKNALDEYRQTGNFSSNNGPVGFVWSSDMNRDGMGPDVLFPAPGRPKPMYLGGYGALFFIQVDYPLLPPPQVPHEQPTAQQEDAVWAQTKRDVLEPQANVVVPQEAGEPSEPYSREKVDTLRGQLIATMKHATNIRVLEPGEWIAVVVQGPAAAPEAAQNPPTAATTPPAASTNAGKTVLMLRATKADVDQYAKGQLNQQQFEQRLQIVTY